MFYETSKGHPLPHNPFSSLVVPRPIGWISTVDAEGRANLAPYSFFNGISYFPPQVMFSSSGRKDTLANCEATGQFVVNLATYELREKVVATSVDAPHGVSEFEYAELTPEPSTLVKPPRVAESPVHLECETTQTIPLEHDAGKPQSFVVMGKVLGISIADWAITGGVVDIAKLRPLARLGYFDYASIDSVFSLRAPKWEG